MFSSSHYYSEMEQLNKKIDKEKEKRKKYNLFLNKLNDIKKSLDSCCESFNSADRSMKNGGYSAEGLDIKPDVLNGSKEDLDSIISKTEMVIKECDKNISNYEELYEAAEANYYDALEAEKESD